MIQNNFLEFQTPILTASSPEGARDFLVPSKKSIQENFMLYLNHPAIKQMIMIAGDRYFQMSSMF